MNIQQIEFNVFQKKEFKAVDKTIKMVNIDYVRLEKGFMISISVAEMVVVDFEEIVYNEIVFN